MEAEDVKQDVERFKTFMKITLDYCEHYQHFKESCVGVDSLNFIFSISHPALGSPVQICHTSSTGIKTMCKENKFPALIVSKEDIEAMLTADLPESLKAKVEEVKNYVA